MKGAKARYQLGVGTASNSPIASKQSTVDALIDDCEVMASKIDSMLEGMLSDVLGEGESAGETSQATPCCLQTQLVRLLSGLQEIAVKTSRLESGMLGRKRKDVVEG